MTSLLNLKDMPFGFCTREKERWCEFAEDSDNGISVGFLRQVSFDNLSLFDLENYIVSFNDILSS